MPDVLAELLPAVPIGGAPVAWLVKDFPAELRDTITRAARGAGMTVAQWLVAHFAQYGVDGTRINPVDLTHVKPATDAHRLAHLAEIARTATVPGKDSRPMRAVRALVERELVGMGAPAPKPATKRLPAPEAPA